MAQTGKTPFLVPRRIFLRLGLLGLTAILSFIIIILPLAIRQGSYLLKTGDVVTQDIQAPYSLTFVSQFRTEQSRNTAEAGIKSVYLPVDPTITRRQIEKLKLDLAFISSVRNDTYASQVQKKADLKSISGLVLSNELIDKTIALPENRWQPLQQESLSVLEQVMRSPVRDNNLEDARRSVSTLTSFTMSTEQAGIIAELVGAYIIPNSLFSAELTKIARQEARTSVQPVSQSFVTGEIILRRGEIITETAYESLAQFGLVQQGGQIQSAAAAFILVAMFAVFQAFYFTRRRLPILQDARSLVLISCLFLIFLFTARFVIPNRAIIPYLFPLSAFALTIGSIFNYEIGLTLSLALSVFTAWDLPNSLDLTLFYMLQSFWGIIILGKGQRFTNFIKAGLAIGFSGIITILAYRLPESVTDWIGLATLCGASIVNGLASASLTLLIQYLLAQLLGVATAMHLLDLSRPDHPLLQFLLRNAPGTYQHALQVSNLAEQAAEAIGADALVVRVGCLYHDVGKSVNPSFFIENQIPGKINPHDDMDPIQSAATIIQHVDDGLMLARKHRIPIRIQDFIREHHGTTLTRYQYVRAVQETGNKSEEVDREKFRYAGPRPRSKETALLMLADGCEARARAELPKDKDEVIKLVRSMCEFIQQEGQLDDTVLTLRDFHKVQNSFVTTLMNTYHPRISYPELPTTPVVAKKNP